MSYNTQELQEQIDGLRLRIQRLQFLRSHTENTTEIDKDIRKDELQVTALQQAINTKENK